MSAKGILKAVKNKGFQELSMYLASKNDEDVNTKDSEGWTLLHYAVINGNVDMVKTLLQNGADPTKVSSEGDTPLHIATRKGSMEIVNILLKHATICRINYIDTKTTLHGDTPLHVAARNGFRNIATTLLSHGAIYNIKNKENLTPLELSKAYTVTRTLNLIQKCFEKARNGDIEIIDELKHADLDEFSAIMNTRNCQNQPLIQEAMVNNHCKLTAELLQMREVDEEGYFNETQATVEASSQFSVTPTNTSDKLKNLKWAAEKYLTHSNIYLSILRTMSRPYGSDKNASPWKSVKQGSYLLESIQYLIDLYKSYYMLSRIEDEDIRLVNDTLVYLQFYRSHISSGGTLGAPEVKADFFVSKGQGTVYYNMLNSDMNSDVRVFIDIVEKNIDTPVRRFLENITQKLKSFL